MLKKVFSAVLSIAIIMSVCTAFPISADAAGYEKQLREAGFPESYVSALSDLHKKYPDWKFVPFKAGMDFNTAVQNERTPHSQQIIQKSASLDSTYYCNCESCCKNGSYTFYEGSYVAASENAVRYYMDARNWLNSEGIFQFESARYSSAQTISGIESILSPTFMHKADITYKNPSGNVVTYKDADGNAVKYSKAIRTAAKDSGLNAYYLASKIVQEIGSTSQNVGGTCGTRAPFKGIFNYYSIGANSGASDGLHWANGKMWAVSDTTLYSTYDSKFGTVGGTKTKVKKHQYMAYIGTYGKYLKVRLYNRLGANSYSTDGAAGYVLKTATDFSSLTYGRPWNNPYKSIYYGAQFIAEGYLEHQYTPYLQKFNVNPDSPQTHSHEYLTNVRGAVDASKISYNAYKKAGILSLERTFYIPVYKNMPSQASPAPPDAVNPLIVQNVKITSSGASTIKLKWSAIEGAEKYDVCLKNVKSGKSYHKEVRALNATFSDLASATAYELKARAYVDGKYQPYSKKVIGLTNPKKPAILAPKTNTKHQIIVRWKKTDCSGYEVQFARDSKFKKLIATRSVDSKKTSYTGKNFTKGRAYYVRVRAYKTNGSQTSRSSWSAAKKIKSK